MRFFKRLLLFVARYVASIFLFSFSITLGVFSKKCRGLIQTICSYFNLDSLGEVFFSELSLPKIDPNDFAVDENIEICEARRDFANASLFELVILACIIKKYEPKTIFEIGTFDGRTTLNFALSSSPNTIVYTLDLPKVHIDTIKFAISEIDKAAVNKLCIGKRILTTQYPQKKKIKQLLGDSATFDFIPYFNSMDMVFIDGAHSYAYVENDTNVALKLLKAGKGIIIWHDYTEYGAVAKFLHNLKSNHPEYSLFHIRDTNMVILYIE